MCGRFSSIQRLALAGAGLFLMQAHPQAEIAGSGPSVPRPRGGSAEVERGSSVLIPLGIFGGSTEQLSFIVREEPTVGTLSGMKTFDRSTSQVTYTHSGESSVEADHFTFAAKSRTGVSAPATVNIRIVDLPALLIAPTRADFGATAVGTVQTREIMLENRGTGVARGAVSTSPPFSLPDDSTYTVGPGESVPLTVHFQPEQPGPTRGYLRFSSDSSRVTELRGEGAPPFSVSTDQLDLDPEARAGDLSITNQTEAGLTLKVEADKRLKVTETMTLEPRESVVYRVKVQPGEPEAFQTNLTISGGGQSARIRVGVPAMPAALALEPVSLAEFQPGERQAVMLKNTGGLPLVAEIQAPAGWQVTPGARVALAPLRSQKVTFVADARSSPVGQIVLSWEGGKIELPVAVNLPAAEPSPSIAPAVAPARQPPASAPPSEMPVPDEPASPVAFVDPSTTREATLPAIGDPVISAVTKRSATLSWPAQKSMRYHIEQQSASYDGSVLKVSWQLSPEDKPTIEEDRGVVTFTGLAPGMNYIVRIYGENADGELTPPTRPVKFNTLPPLSLLPSWRTTLLLILIGLIVTVVIRRRRRLTISY